MRYRLVHLSGGLAGRVHDIDESEIVLGRDTAAHVVLCADDRLVSRRHASLIHEDGALLLRDLDSSTGTFLDGEDIEEAELADGDVFELGRGGPRIRVEMPEESLRFVDHVHPPLAGSITPIPDHALGAPIPPNARLRITLLSGVRGGETLDLAGSVIHIGRAPGNAVALPDDRAVASQHAKLVRLAEGYVLMDLESPAGTLLNGTRVARARLRSGDVIGLGSEGPDLRFEILPPDAADHGSHATIVIPHFHELVERRRSGVVVHDVALDRAVLTIGRDPHADIRLDSPIVGKFHARLLRREAALYVEDLDSANGTYLNARRIDQAALSLGDRIVVGPFQIETLLGRLRVLDTRNRARLDVRGLTVWERSRPSLEGVSLHLPPGSFTTVIGSSRSGKSTLLHALAGLLPKVEGEVLLNGVDLYHNRDSLKTAIGFVPPQDVVQPGLTVRENLEFAARLRLPPDTSPVERRKRCESVMAKVELTDRSARVVSRLSRMQRKRVALAVELLADPSLLLVDEPASNLDTGDDETMMLLLRELSYKGKTVVAATRTLDHVHLCDYMAVLDQGCLVFFGLPEEARAHFGVPHMVELYDRIREKDAATWQAGYLGTPIHQQRVAAPLETAPEAEHPSLAPQEPGPRQSLRQFAALTRRRILSLWRDMPHTLLLAAQAPIIAALIGLSLLHGGFEAAETKPIDTILFLLSLAAIWMGGSGAARMIALERGVFRRERAVFLELSSYMASQIVPLLLLAASQDCVVLLFLKLWFDPPGSTLFLLLAMLLTSLVGIVLGLLLSAFARRGEQAILLLAMLLAFQALFAFPSLRTDLHGPAGSVAKATPAYWSFDLMRRVALRAEDAVADDDLTARLEQGLPALMTHRRYQSMRRDGHPMFRYRRHIEIAWIAMLPERLGGFMPEAWRCWRPILADIVILLFFSALILAALGVALRRVSKRP